MITTNNSTVTQTVTKKNSVNTEGFGFFSGERGCETTAKQS